MKQILFLSGLTATLCLGFIRLAAAEESKGAARPMGQMHALTCPIAILKGCCDDYCSKPLPCIRDLCYGCRRDDYCMKPLPPVPCFLECGATDCYCRKPCPVLFRPLAADYFSCANWGVGCPESRRGPADRPVSTAASGR